MNVYSYVPNGKKSVGVEESSLIEMAFFAVYSFIPHFKYLKFINFILLSPGYITHQCNSLCADSDQNQFTPSDIKG